MIKTILSHFSCIGFHILRFCVRHFQQPYLVRSCHLYSARKGDYNTACVLTSFSWRSLSVDEPGEWNRLPEDLRGLCINSLLKTKLFTRANGAIIDVADNLAILKIELYSIYSLRFIFLVFLDDVLYFYSKIMFCWAYIYSIKRLCTCCILYGAS